MTILRRNRILQIPAVTQFRIVNFPFRNLEFETYKIQFTLPYKITKFGLSFEGNAD